MAYWNWSNGPSICIGLESAGYFFFFEEEKPSVIRNISKSDRSSVVSGGLESALALYDAPDKAIVAVGIHDLVDVAKSSLSWMWSEFSEQFSDIISLRSA